MKAVLFDLDDTLFDHKFSRLQALEALQQRFSRLKDIPLKELEEEHQRLLDADYSNVLDRKISIEEGINQRVKKLLAMYGVTLSSQEAKNAADLYNQEYQKNRQAVPGTRELLVTLMNYAKLGVVTNGLVEPQMEKLHVCKIDKLVDYVIISETVGYQKPSRGLFEAALEKVNTKPSDAVFVGDSWECDILPAVAVGMKAVWLNRYGKENPNPKIACEINSFKDVEKDLFLP
jgi:5'-nucleotidase